MEDWRTLYQQKLTTAEEAVKHIKSGDRVVVTHATGEPILLTDAMVANAEQYENVEVVHPQGHRGGPGRLYPRVLQRDSGAVPHQPAPQCSAAAPEHPR